MKRYIYGTALAALVLITGAWQISPPPASGGAPATCASGNNYACLNTGNTFTQANLFGDVRLNNSTDSIDTQSGNPLQAANVIPLNDNVYTLGQSSRRWLSVYASTLISSVATGTAPISVVSTTPVANLTVANHPTVQYCGISNACSGTAIASSQTIFGSTVLSSGTPSSVTITGISPTFSNTSYICTVTSKVNAGTVAAFAVNNISTSSFQIVGPAANTDTVGFICIGPK